MTLKTKQAYFPIEKIIGTSKQSASTSWQCNTSGNLHQPAKYGDLCLKRLATLEPTVYKLIAVKSRYMTRTYHGIRGTIKEGLSARIEPKLWEMFDVNLLVRLSVLGLKQSVQCRADNSDFGFTVRIWWENEPMQAVRNTPFMGPNLSTSWEKNLSLPVITLNCRAGHGQAHWMMCESWSKQIAGGNCDLHQNLYI